MIGDHKVRGARSWVGPNGELFRPRAICVDSVGPGDVLPSRDATVDAHGQGPRQIAVAVDNNTPEIGRGVLEIFCLTSGGEGERAFNRTVGARFFCRDRLEGCNAQDGGESDSRQYEGTRMLEIHTHQDCAVATEFSAPNDPRMVGHLTDGPTPTKVPRKSEV